MGFVGRGNKTNNKTYNIASTKEAGRPLISESY